MNFHIAKQIAQFAYTFLLQLAVVVEFFSIRIKLRLSIIRNLISIEKLSCWSKPSPLISVSSLRRTEEVRYLCYAFSKIIYNLHNFRHFIIGLVIHWPSIRVTHLSSGCDFGTDWQHDEKQEKTKRRKDRRENEKHAQRITMTLNRFTFFIWLEYLLSLLTVCLCLMYLWLDTCAHVLNALPPPADYYEKTLLNLNATQNENKQNLANELAIEHKSRCTLWKT